MKERILGWLFGCPHQNLGWPRTERSRVDGWILVRNYRCCMDCGKEISYSGPLAEETK